ncbi:MAG: hypothetical protein L6R42_009796 [Xanthoria sp. 1 TBL-2021]|nr:MAG: hypothetical protein L6R42_009796 [Xanthoria sp. 1 TBL-2021]
MSESSYIEATTPSSPPSSPSEIDSLPSSPTTSTLQNEDSDEEEEGESDAEREWKESLQQLELLLTMVVVPYMGKYFGRKCAYWGWARFMEWKYPDVEIVVTSEKTFKGAGAVEAAATL